MRRQYTLKTLTENQSFIDPAIEFNIFNKVQYCNYEQREQSNIAPRFENNKNNTEQDWVAFMSQPYGFEVVVEFWLS